MCHIQTYFTTGEFASFCGVSKHTLFHYDHMGIFSPAVTRENGYRGYAVAQLDVFNVIATLKELGMPLVQIKAYLDRRSPQELVKLLEQEETLLDEKIRRLGQMRDLVRQKAELTRKALGLNPEEIRREHAAETLLVRTPASPLTSDRNLALSTARHIHFCEANDIYSPHAMGAMIGLETVQAGDFVSYSHFYTQVDCRPQGVEVFTRAAAPYLVTCHLGGYDTTARTYQRILDYGVAHHLTLIGPFFEDLLLDELSGVGEENYMLQISIRVLSKNK